MACRSEHSKQTLIRDETRPLDSIKYGEFLYLQRNCYIVTKDGIPWSNIFGEKLFSADGQ